MKLGLLGDTMLGRGVATKLHEEGPTGLCDDLWGNGLITEWTGTIGY